jgi:hypothetical protein
MSADNDLIITVNDSTLDEHLDHRYLYYLIYCALDSASLLVKLKPRIFQRLPPFE